MENNIIDSLKLNIKNCEKRLDEINLSKSKKIKSRKLMIFGSCIMILVNGFTLTYGTINVINNLKKESTYKKPKYEVTYLSKEKTYSYYTFDKEDYDYIVIKSNWEKDNDYYSRTISKYKINDLNYTSIYDINLSTDLLELVSTQTEKSRMKYDDYSIEIYDYNLDNKIMVNKDVMEIIGSYFLNIIGLLAIGSFDFLTIKLMIELIESKLNEIKKLKSNNSDYVDEIQKLKLILRRNIENLEYLGETYHGKYR